MKKTLAFLLAAVMLLGAVGCTTDGGGNTDTTAAQQTTSGGSSTTAAQQTTAAPSSNAVKDWVTYRTVANEFETWNPQWSQSAKELDYIVNMVEGLLSNNNYGQLIPAAAESWGTDDGGLTWTFTLRDGLKWVDYQGNEKADVVAEDWLWGLEWVLNYHKNNANNISMPTEMIKGAQEYYDYTKDLDEAAGKALGLDTFLDMVGIESPDAKTVIYTAVDQLPYFDTLACYNCLYPVSGQLLDELGVEGYVAVQYNTLWYSGPYRATTYVQNNEKVFTKNESYWNQDIISFDTVTVKMVESSDVAFQMYTNGELDNVDLTEANLTTIYNNPSHQFHDYLVEARPTKYSYQIHFVYSTNQEDGTEDVQWNTAIANTAFRLAWYYGLDTATYLRRINAINPVKCDNYAYSARNLAFTSDGTDYTDLVIERLGITPSTDVIARLDSAKFAQYKQQAIDELTAKGISLPIEADYYIQASNQTSLDSATVLKQTIEDSLGSDFVVMNIKTYITNMTNEVRTPKLASFFINGWGADYGDPLNFVSQELYGLDNAYYSISYSKINDATDPDLIATYQEFTRLTLEADKIKDDTDKRYNAFADAEAYMISNALTIPIYYNITWELTKVNDYSKIYAPYGIQNNKWVNWVTNADGYTTEDYAAFEAAYNAGK